MTIFLSMMTQLHNQRLYPAARESEITELPTRHGNGDMKDIKAKVRPGKFIGKLLMKLSVIAVPVLYFFFFGRYTEHEFALETSTPSPVLKYSLVRSFHPLSSEHERFVVATFRDPDDAPRFPMTTSPPACLDLSISRMAPGVYRVDIGCKEISYILDANNETARIAIKRRRNEWYISDKLSPMVSTLLMTDDFVLVTDQQLLHQLSTAVLVAQLNDGELIRFGD